METLYHIAQNIAIASAYFYVNFVCILIVVIDKNTTNLCSFFHKKKGVETRLRSDAQTEDKLVLYPLERKIIKKTLLLEKSASRVTFS